MIAVLRYGLLAKIFMLFYYFSGSILAGNTMSLTSEISDSFISAFLIIILPSFVFLFRNKIRFLNYNPGLSLSVLLVLLLASVFAPLTASFNPEFQKNVAVTKLLHPFSVRYFITPAGKETSFYVSLRDEVTGNVTDEIQIADSLASGGGYYQGAEKILFEGSPADYNTSAVLYIFGTDELGRDIYSRLIYGTRISLTVGLTTVVLAFFIGLLLGFPAGYYEGWIGKVINRITDMFLSFPSIFLVILILALFGNSVITVIIVLGFTGWMSLFKIIRGEVKALKSRDFFMTASSLGLSSRNLIFREMLPVVIAPVTSNLVLLFAGVIVAEASLSYLGLGTGVTHPSWGSMIEQGQNYISKAWWMIIIPGIFLFTTLFAANNIGKKVQTYFNPGIR